MNNNEEVFTKHDLHKLIIELGESMDTILQERGGLGHPAFEVDDENEEE